ncbi:unnamed protein product [Rotaria sp. Silwood2]|nr:unnamed protein product [Rotaria sp. Silwood2]
MNSETIPIFPGGTAINTDARGKEIYFLCGAILAIIAADVLTIFSLVSISPRHEGFVYAILILVTSALLITFLVTGILYQRITDMLAFLITTFLLCIYVIIHFIVRWKESDCTNKNILVALKYSPISTTTTTTTTTIATTTCTTIVVSQSLSRSIVPIATGLYVCIGLNYVSFALSMFLAYQCFRNFAKGLKEMAFRTQVDQWLQQCCSRTCFLFNKNSNF